MGREGTICKMTKVTVGPMEIAEALTQLRRSYQGGPNLGSLWKIFFVATPLLHTTVPFMLDHLLSYHESNKGGLPTDIRRGCRNEL
jgi:hypothetical protein